MDRLEHMAELCRSIGEVSRRDELLELVGVILSTQSNLAGTKKYHDYVEHAINIAAHVIARVDARLQQGGQSDE